MHVHLCARGDAPSPDGTLMRSVGIVRSLTIDVARMRNKTQRPCGEATVHGLKPRRPKGPCT